MCTLCLPSCVLCVFSQAKLRVVPWDGYLKYYNLGEKHPQLIEKRRKVSVCVETWGKAWEAT